MSFFLKGLHWWMLSLNPNMFRLANDVITDWFSAAIFIPSYMNFSLFFRHKNVEREIALRATTSNYATFCGVKNRRRMTQIFSASSVTAKIGIINRRREKKVSGLIRDIINLSRAVVIWKRRRWWQTAIKLRRKSSARKKKERSTIIQCDTAGACY